MFYKPKPPPPALGDDEAAALRQAVHRAVDRMTCEELERLTLPARLFVEAEATSTPRR